MKIDKLKVTMVAGQSLFIGIILFAIAFGSLFPNIFKLTAPLICRGEVQVESIRYSYKPGQVGWQRYVYCINDASGEKEEITFPAIIVTGLIASVFIFAIQFHRERRNIFVEKSTLERLNELAEMRNEGRITEEEYKEKTGTIVKDL